MFQFAMKGLLRSRLQTILMTSGITFSAFLLLVQIGILYGFAQTSAALIDHIDADLWMTRNGTTSAQTSYPFSDSVLGQLRAFRGVAKTGVIRRQRGLIRSGIGEYDSVDVIGFDATSEFGAPIELYDGNIQDLKLPMTIFLNYSPSIKWLFPIDSYTELAGKKVRIVGHTRNITSLDGQPTIFTSNETFQNLYPGLKNDRVNFIIIKPLPEVSPRVLAAEIKNKFKNYDIHLKNSFSVKTSLHWTFDTGIGYGFLFSALLAFSVGNLIVGQLFYSSTTEKLPEYGILKAIGTSHQQLYKILFFQVGFIATAGYIIAILVALITAYFSSKAGLTIIINPTSLTLSLIGILICCFISTRSAIQKVIKVDPAIVFRG